MSVRLLTDVTHITEWWWWWLETPLSPDMGSEVGFCWVPFIPGHQVCPLVTAAEHWYQQAQPGPVVEGEQRLQFLSHPTHPRLAEHGVSFSLSGAAFMHTSGNKSLDTSLKVWASRKFDCIKKPLCSCIWAAAARWACGWGCPLQLSTCFLCSCCHPDPECSW